MLLLYCFFRNSKNDMKIVQNDHVLKKIGQNLCKKKQIIDMSIRLFLYFFHHSVSDISLHKYVKLQYKSKYNYTIKQRRD